MANANLGAWVSKEVAQLNERLVILSVLNKPFFASRSHLLLKRFTLGLLILI